LFGCCEGHIAYAQYFQYNAFAAPRELAQLVDVVDVVADFAVVVAAVVVDSKVAKLAMRPTC